MKRIIYLTALCLALLSCLATIAQDFSNKGKDFWIAYTGHIDGTASVMGLYLTSDVNATGSVKVGGTVLPFSITANQVTTLFIGGSSGAVTNAFVYNGQSDEIAADRGIHVVADKNIVVYAHIIRSARSGATLVLPTPVLGKDYIVPSYRNTGNGGGNAGYGQITVVAVEDNTTIEIRPTVGDRNGAHPANVPFTVVLRNKGDVYQIQSALNQDYSGTKVRSVSVAGAGCKPIAVFSSTTWSGFDCVNASGGDNLYQQLFPTKSWGKKFVTAPFINKPYDIIRVFVQNSGTSVTKTEGGLTTPLTALIAGSYYEVKTSQPLVIEADEPVSVVQYITSQTCGGGNSDPEMTLINPVEQTLDEITLFSAHQSYVPPGQTQITQHYINVVIPTSHKSTFRIDGRTPIAGWVDIAGSGYSYLQEDVTFSSASNPVHTLLADTGFTAIVYGYGNVESYGYNAGTNVRDLYQFVSIYNEYATVNFPATCVGAPFYFSMVFPYQPTEIEWQFGGLFPDVTLVNPVHDSTWLVNGRQVYRYKLSAPYSITTVGTYPITVVAQNPTADGCGNEQEINYDLEVFAKPLANFNFATNGCVSTPVSFTDLTNAGGREIIKWSWDFGDGGTSNLQNPTHLYPTAGSYTAKFSIITDVGCISDTIPKVVNLNQSPVAKFGATGPLCIGNTITFTDSSTTATAAPLVKWIWNFGDGSPVVTATTNAPQPHTYTAGGTYNVTLQVETATGCRSGIYNLSIIINTKPTASFTNGGTCLPDGATQFTDASSGGTGFTYLWNFGDGGTSTLQNPVHNYTTAGPFTVTLTVTTGAGCTDDTTIVVNTVYAQPVAGINVNKTESCLGETLNFSGASSTAPGSLVVQWNWSFDDGTTATGVNPSKTFTTTGNHTATLVVTSAAGCVSAPITISVMVNPLPTPRFIITTPSCATKDITFEDVSISNAGIIVRRTWNMGDGTPATDRSAGSFNYQYTSVGTYTVTLQVQTDKGCVSTVFDSTIMVTALPMPAFTMPESCVNDPFSLFTNTSTIADGSEAGFSFAWNFGDPAATPANPNTSNLRNPQHKYINTGLYPVTLVVTSDKGCSNTLTQDFTVNGGVPLSSFTVNGGSEVCSNTPVSITNASTVDRGNVVKLEIFWDATGDLTNKTVDEDPLPSRSYTTTYPVFFTPASKTFTVRVRAYSGQTCFDDEIKTITVKARPDIQFTAISGVCEDVASKTITASVTNVPGTGVFSGPGVTSTGIFTPSVAGAGIHTIRYTFTGTNGCADFKEQTIEVSPMPVIRVTTNRTVLEDGSITMDATVVADNPTYVWTPATWLSNSAIARPIASPKEDITYTLNVTSEDGCTASATVFVKVLKVPTIPNVFTPNGDNINDRWEIPFLDTYVGATIEIYNRYGQLVYQSKGYSKPWDGTVNGKPVPMGTYYYLINPKNGRKQMSGFVDIIR